MRSREIVAGVTTIGVFAFGGSALEETTDLRFDGTPEPYEANAADCAKEPFSSRIYRDRDTSVVPSDNSDNTTFTLGDSAEFDETGQPTQLKDGFIFRHVGSGIYEIVSSVDKVGQRDVVDLTQEPYVKIIEGAGEYSLRLTGEIELDVPVFTLACISSRTDDSIAPGSPTKSEYIRPLPLAPKPVPPKAPRTLDA